MVVTPRLEFQNSHKWSPNKQVLGSGAERAKFVSAHGREAYGMARQQERSVALVPDRTEVTMQKGYAGGTCLEDCRASFFVSLSQTGVI